MRLKSAPYGFRGLLSGLMVRGLLWFALIGCGAVQAAVPALDSAKRSQLSQHEFWLLLNRYERDAWGRWRSHVVDESFFLSKEGLQDPQAELVATLKALYAPVRFADQHAQCVYPARARWLREQLQLTDLPKVDCPAFQQWFAEINPHHVVLVFPAAYLNSPSSIFGHTLLRVDPPEAADQGTSLLSYALNFGAAIDDADNSMLYAWKGVMGGYPGQFAILPYHEKIAEYNRLENRDLWEYSLNITPDEAVRMLEHVWELQRFDFDYYFFDENCSYRVLELLEVARPGLRLTQDFHLTAIPTDTVKAVQEAGLVTQVRYRASRERELLVREAELTEQERTWAKQLAEGERTLEDTEFQRQPTARRALIQDAAYRLLRYRATGKDRDTQTARRSYALLRGIQDNPPNPLEVTQPEVPELGHQSRSVTGTLGQRESRTFAEYGLRMAYHDLNDRLTGFPLGAQIEIAKLAVRQYEGGHWQFQNLELAGIRSMTPRTDLLKPWSWQVRGGLERVLDQHEQEVLVSHVSGGGGVTQAWTDQLRTFGLVTARLEHNRNFGAFLAPALGFNTGLLWHNTLGGFVLEGSGDYFHNGTVRRQFQATQQWDWDKNLGIRFSLRRDFTQGFEPVTEAGLALRWYFY